MQAMFIDVDGTLSSPCYKVNGKFQIGMSDVQWADYCSKHGSAWRVDGSSHHHDALRRQRFAGLTLGYQTKDIVSIISSLDGSPEKMSILKNRLNAPSSSLRPMRW